VRIRQPTAQTEFLQQDGKHDCEGGRTTSRSAQLD
jgi:hypothetical protein